MPENHDIKLVGWFSSSNSTVHLGEYDMKYNPYNAFIMDGTPYYNITFSEPEKLLDGFLVYYLLAKTWVIFGMRSDEKSSTATRTMTISNVYDLTRPNGSFFDTNLCNSNNCTNLYDIVKIVVQHNYYGARKDMEELDSCLNELQDSDIKDKINDNEFCISTTNTVRSLICK